MAFDVNTVPFCHLSTFIFIFSSHLILLHLSRTFSNFFHPHLSTFYSHSLHFTPPYLFSHSFTTTIYFFRCWMSSWKKVSWCQPFAPFVDLTKIQLDYWCCFCIYAYLIPHHLLLFVKGFIPYFLIPFSTIFLFHSRVFPLLSIFLIHFPASLFSLINLQHFSFVVK